MSIAIIIAEDHALFRSGLKQLLAPEPDLRVVGEADSGPEAVRLAEELRPDVMLLDLTMPGGSGLEAIARIRKVSPETRILIISMHASGMHVRSAFKEGAHGYLLKTVDSEEFLFAVRAVGKGNQYISSELTGLMVEWCLGQSDEPQSSLLESLTLREREILRMVAAGQSNKEIAAHLFLSEKTVITHRANFMRKLGLHNVREVTMFAITHGLMQVDGQ
ncbi:MAG TPA: response regulator transcription factor [Candidatus Desulfovibrio gallistercoris]|uniref:response regulator n=1 Tax=uncultured Desulfovibrio sp. TaxID=167968 RepID=UPI001F8702C5|nr:response regulator transcription factor [uncultured Desulfovibrio sp.]HJA76650.1 response regulator transcription factor [Candidatus Desulfovibrio gallistercoris]